MKKTFYLFLFSLLLLYGLKVEAQILPYTVNSASGSGKINNQLYDFSIGEMVLVQTFQTNSAILTQGFLQPFLVIQTAANVSIANNILTPNGDGKNDFFVVKGIEQYPTNKLSIFDRGGRLLYSTINYQNNWDGYFNGKPLMEDTYYYLLDLGNDGSVKGFISILYKK
ncbi:gliding motility-associated C-terminal domain-containing protein [Pedobacter frigidisoli]|uniref:Gliding motility-associated C-terminal domain-containing protein n=1 Tax=Pedobacter frigidisoli TaxID=2530455 RepID=A0A4R0P0E4_9SPHI|nr:gliding motility-associated C-terminal domain-containing protein [Pedobacter frigidisoli]TCD10137.1 gliding motility-associated C-terminal domain-containing protein [Pedobacter frigidisoli]